MTNNLIFTNGATLSICPTQAADAPRMVGGGWRQWHVTASCADAAAALASGLLRREYESVTGADEDGNPVTEVLVEDLAAYVVPGSVVDHMDGTVTVFARRESELERTSAACAALGVDASDPASAPARLAEIQTLAAHADMLGEDKTIIDMPAEYCPEWVDGMALKAGQPVRYKGIKYLVQQAVSAQAHYPPDMADGAMLAVYKPYQGKHGYDWLYGEYCEVGYTRYDGGVLYVAVQAPGANIFRPSEVPAVWEVVE